MHGKRLPDKRSGGVASVLVGLALAALVVLVMPRAFGAGVARAAGDCTVTADDVNVDAEEQALLSGINAYRSQNGRSLLRLSPTVGRAAAWMARDMATKRYVEHTDSLGRSPVDRMRDCGVFVGASLGEDLACGSPDAGGTLNQWKASAAHNAVLLDPTYRTAGIARALDAAGSCRAYWTLNVSGADDSGAGQAPGVGRAPTTPVQPTGAGTVVFAVTLVSPTGQLASGALSGYVFSLSGAAGAFTSPPTNTQGQTTLTVPPGNYVVSEQANPSAVLAGFNGTVSAAGGLTVVSGATVAVTAVNQVVAPAQPPGPTPAPPPAPAPSLPALAVPATESVPLSAACNNVTLTWPAGTPLGAVAAAINPGDGLVAIWRYDSAQGVFVGFSPRPNAPADYRAIGSRLETAFVCTSAPAVLSRPLA